MGPGSGDRRERGLTSAEAAESLAAHGPNALPRAAPERWWARVARQLRSSIIYILLFALVFDLVVWIAEGAGGAPYESIAIALILAFNTGMGVWQEYRAEDALTRLQELAAPRVVALRDGVPTEVEAAALVPGDVVRLEAGDRVPADGTVVGERGVMIDESVLTGESVPVERSVADPVLSGTLAVRGSTWMEVTGTGPASAMGRIATMLASVGVGRTPLERDLERLGHRIARWVAVVAVVLAVSGVVIEGVDRASDMILFAVAVAVAAVPEGLPAVLTLTLALGTERMSVRKAVVRRLAAVEALGAVTVIATDKTGTLTENSMTVQGLDSPDPARALRAMVLASDAEPDATTGDPLEHGLYRFASQQGVDAASLRQGTPRRSSRPFDAAWRYMRVNVDEDGHEVAYLKGAAEVLLARSELSDAERDEWQDRVEAAAGEGDRVLALAWSPDGGEEALQWLGIVRLWDPPRAEVPAAVAATRAAGIRVVMITGDHPATARAIADRLGLPPGPAVTGDELDRMDPQALADVVGSTHVFARVTAEHKLALVEALRARGDIVAMTGDGVNDAPALKRSDIGVAMGQRGSDVTREVADLVLLDDNFATIVAAVEEGRGIDANVRNFLRFLFSTNVALVLLVAIGVIGAALFDIRDDAGDLLVPLTAVQLLWINVIADGPPALALGLDRNPGVMAHPPRPPDTPLLDRDAVRFIVGTGVLKAVLGVALLFTLVGLGHSGEETRTAVFLYESLAQLAFVYPSRHAVARPERNRVLNLIVAVSVVLQLLTVALPPLRAVLGLQPLDATASVLLAAALAVSIAGANLVVRRPPVSGAPGGGRGPAPRGCCA